MPQAAVTPKPLHIFKPGRHTTVRGETIEFSEADLQAIAKAYDPKLSKAPLVVGHPKIDSPAQGWAVSLTATERGLYAAADKVAPEFAEAVRAGRYGTISAKFYRPTDAGNPVPGVWYLRHIGFLGAQPPAVKGLDDPEFAEADDGCVCFQEGVAFSDWDAMTTANLFRNLREWVLSKFGQEEADKVIPSYDVRALELSAAEEVNQRRTAQGLPVAFADPATTTDHPPQESAVNEAEAAQLRAQNEAQARQIADLQAAQTKRQAEQVLADNVAFAESLASEARIPAAMTAKVAAIGAQLQGLPADVEFAEGDVRKPLHQVYREMLRALPAAVEFGEQATRDRAASQAQAGADTQTPVEFAEGADPERVALDGRIRTHAKQHGIPYAAAAHAVMRAK